MVTLNTNATSQNPGRRPTTSLLRSTTSPWSRQSTQGRSAVAITRSGHVAPVLRHLREAPELEQLQPQRFDVGEDPVKRGLVRKGAPQERVPAQRLGLQGGERPEQRLSQVAANTDLVACRRLRLTTHRGSIVGQRRVIGCHPNGVILAL